MISEYTVTGMTCEHCVRAVADEVAALSGVGTVEVDLASGRLSITSEGQVDEQAVRRAVDEAGGYQLA